MLLQFRVPFESSRRVNESRENEASRLVPG